MKANELLSAVARVITRSRPQGQDDWLTCDDAGEYCAYLASKAAKDITGETIHFKDREQLDAIAL